MTLHVHRGSWASDPAQRAEQLAERIYVRIQLRGTRQVRWHNGRMLTYPYPARKGYGTRGVMVGIYSINARMEWIQEDLLQVLSTDPNGSES